jgi:hypothetical protein
LVVPLVNALSLTPAAAPPAAHERFLRALTPEMARQVLALPALLDQHGDSLVVFTARKSVLLADVLRRLGYWRPQGDFTSNRALDGNLSLLDGRDVLIVEDLAASCRTLLSTIETVRAAGAAEVRCFALSVEGPRRDWERVLGVEFESPYLASNIDDSLRHARSVVDAFAALPRPYNIDWPLHAFDHPLPIELISEAGWRRITTEESRADALSIEPGRMLRSSAGRLLPQWIIEIFESSHLSKIRLYPVRNPHPRGTHVFAVPVVALGALSGQQITSCLRDLTDLVGIQPVKPTSTREAYRVLQFLLGGVLLELFGVSLGVPVSQQDEITASFLFVPGVREQVLRAQSAVHEWARKIPWVEQRAPLPARMLLWDDVEPIDMERRVVDEYLTSVFLDSYVESSEYRLRHELRAARSADARMGLVRELVEVERATDGASFTAGQLRERLTYAGPELTGLQDSRELVSAFLDRAIDAGEVVPDVDIDLTLDVASRRFRPGEIISFERDTQADVEAMLHAFARRTGRYSFSKDLLQKLIVGFIGFLLDRGRLADQRATGPSMRDVDRLQRRYHLRGAILDGVAGDFVGQQPEPEAARRLVHAGVISPGNTGYLLSATPVLESDTGPDYDATLFGKVLADVVALRNEQGRRQLDEDDLGRLVTLVTPIDHVLALGADLVIAIQQMGPARSSSELLATKPLSDAINNGLAKAAWIEENSSRRVVGAIRKRLPMQDDLYAAGSAAVLGALMPKDGESTAKTETRRLIAWFRDLYVWWSWIRFCAATEADETRSERLERDLTNRAFVAVGGLALKPKAAKARDRLRRHLLDEERLPRDAYEAIASEVQTELLNAAARLRAECYNINSRALGSVPRQASIETCLLVRSDGEVHGDLSPIKGLSRALMPTNLAGEKLLGQFGMLVPIENRFDLAQDGPSLMEMLEVRRLESVLVVDMPDRFRPSRIPDQQVALLWQAFVELVELLEECAATTPGLSVIMPERASSDTAMTVRKHGEMVTEHELLSCVWQIWRYAPPGEQLPLSSEGPPVQPLSPLTGLPTDEESEAG